MKKYGAILALLVAIVSGLFAVFLANRWLAKQTPSQETVVIQEKTGMATAKVVIAARDLEVGSPLNPSSLSLAEWPRTSVPRGALEDLDAIAGRIAVTRLRAGQPVLASDLAPPGSGPGLVAAITPGKRAMAIRVDEVIGVGGFILPNTFVDVIAIEEKSPSEPKARTLLERIEVLAIAQETYNEEGKPKIVKTVTLQLAPEQAETLALHTSKSSVQLVLRNPLDEPGPQPPPQIAKAEGRSLPVLQPRIRMPKPAPHAVEVIRRSHSEELRFKNVESEEKI